MSTSARRIHLAVAPANGWLTEAERNRPSRFRQTAAASPLPAEEVVMPTPRGVRWGQGPLLDTITLQCGTDPRDLRRRRRG
jgi:hypothetical protein